MKGGFNLQRLCRGLAAEQVAKMPIKESCSVDVSVESYRKIGAIYEADVKVVITGIDSKKEYIIII